MEIPSGKNPWAKKKAGEIQPFFKLDDSCGLGLMQFSQDVENDGQEDTAVNNTLD